MFRSVSLYRRIIKQDKICFVAFLYTEKQLSKTKYVSQRFSTQEKHIHGEKNNRKGRRKRTSEGFSFSIQEK